MQRVFLLSPARVGGVRARLLLNADASFPLARQFHRAGLTLAEVFTFASGLYFRGKITYARRFARPDRREVIRVITSNAGLLDPDTPVTPAALTALGKFDIDATDPRYTKPLRRDARSLARALAPDGVAILLGSIATAKYRDLLLEAFGQRLVLPGDFVGRGDMSRGGLLLRAARDGRERSYLGVRGAVLTSRRAPRLAGRRAPSVAPKKSQVDPVRASLRQSQPARGGRKCPETATRRGAAQGLASPIFGDRQVRQPPQAPAAGTAPNAFPKDRPGASSSARRS